MNKKLTWGIFFLFSLCLLTFSSCSEEDDEDYPRPVIELEELGSGHDSPNDRIAYIGENAHIEASVVAEGLIKQIDVEVHQKEGSYTFSKTYTDSKYVGKKNTTFHEHLDIPSEAIAGEYHLHFTVTDQLGQTSTVEADLELKESSVAITIEELTMGAGHDFPNNKIGYIGTAPVIEATSISAENGIDKIVVEMHNESTSVDYEIDTTYVYNGETQLTDFHKHVFIPNNTPAGDYHMHFKVYDKNGETLEKSMELEIKTTGITVSDLEVGENNEASATNIHTEFKINATDPLTSIRVRMYKQDAPTDYFYNVTYSDAFASEDVKEYTFHEHLVSTATVSGEYILEIRINDNKGAYKVLKESLNIIQ